MQCWLFSETESRLFCCLGSILWTTQYWWEGDCTWDYHRVSSIFWIRTCQWHSSCDANRYGGGGEWFSGVGWNHEIAPIFRTVFFISFSAGKEPDTKVNKKPEWFNLVLAKLGWEIRRLKLSLKPTRSQCKWSSELGICISIVRMKPVIIEMMSSEDLNVIFNRNRGTRWCIFVRIMSEKKLEKKFVV